MASRLSRPAAASAACIIQVVTLPAQHRVSPRNTYERVYAVLPLVGAGTAEDPRRPMFVPLPPGPGDPPSRSGILAYAWQETDDGRYAVVLLVAADRAAFQEILAERDRRPDVKVFEKGRARRADIEAEFRRVKRDIDFERFGVNLP